MPDAIEIYDDRLRALVRPGATLQKIANNAVWSEGPVYFHEDDSVVWSDAHGNRLLRWSARNLRQPHFRKARTRSPVDRIWHFLICDRPQHPWRTAALTGGLGIEQ